MSFPSRPSATVDASDLSLLIKWVASPQASPAHAGSYTGRTSVTPSFTPSETGTLQPVLAQQFDQDFFASSGEILSNFVESGQIWALLIGIVLGYLVRGLTSY